MLVWNDLHLNHILVGRSLCTFSSARRLVFRAGIASRDCAKPCSNIKAHIRFKPPWTVKQLPECGGPVPVPDNPFGDSLTSLFTGVVEFCSAAVEEATRMVLSTSHG